MNSVIRRTISCLLTVSLIFSSILFSSCKRETPREAQVITEDDPWFDYNVTEIGGEYTGDNYTGLIQEYITTYNGNHYLRTNGYLIDNIDVYNSQGRRIQSKNIKEDLQVNEYIARIHALGENLIVDTYTDKKIYQTSYSLSNLNEFTKEEISSSITSDCVYNGSFDTRGVSMRVFSNINGVIMIRFLEVETDDGRSGIIDLNQVMLGSSMTEVKGIYKVSDTTVMIDAIGMSGNGSNSTQFYLLSLEDFSISEVSDSDFEWLDEYGIQLSNSYIETSCGDSSVMLAGGTVLNFEEETVEFEFSYNDSYIDAGIMMNMDPVYSDGDTFVYFVQTGFLEFEYDTLQSRIVTFVRSDVNPLVGKTIITALNPGAMSTAIAEYNENSEYYFIKIKTTNPADYAPLIRPDMSDTVAYSHYLDECERNMYLQIQDDIISGIGPDIVFGAEYLDTFNNKDCFVDLTNRVNNLNSEEYFMNILETAQTDNHYYRIPVLFYLRGFMAQSDTISGEEYGMTYDEYYSYATEVSNMAPLCDNKARDFARIIVNQFDLFYDGNTVDFDNDAFRTSAEFYKDSVFETDNFFDVQETPQLYIFDQYLMYAGIYPIVGEPSFDGRGTRVSSADVAITKGSPVEDEAWNFVRSLLSYETQRSLAEQAMIPVNVLAFEECATTRLNEYNSNIGRYYAFDEYTMDNLGFSNGVPNSVIYDFENIILNASDFNDTYDPAIFSIIYEEIQPYFADNRTIDEIIDYLEDRITTLLSERAY